MADLLELTRNCSLDTWSQGKTVRLAADLDLTGAAFTPIPTFGGTFDGQGHTISGLSLTANGSKQGLFRTIQPGGVVENLNVSGTVAPGGARPMWAASPVSTAAPSGAVPSAVPSPERRRWAASPDATRKPARSRTAQSPVCPGESGTGGIVGRNLGVLLMCSSSASVNTSERGDSAPSVEDLTDLDLESTLTGEDSGEAESLLDTHTDTGGVAGYSSGVIQSCSNTGTVGYPHVGYNIGGIVGRQTRVPGGLRQQRLRSGEKGRGRHCGAGGAGPDADPRQRYIGTAADGTGYTGRTDPTGH